MYNKAEHFTDIEFLKPREDSKNPYYYGKFFCILNGKTYDSLRGLTNTLRMFDLSAEEFYRKYYMEPDEDVCRANPGYKTKFLNIFKGYSENCNKCPECRARIRQSQSVAAKDEEVIRRKVEAGRIWRENNPDLALACAKRTSATTYERYGEDYYSEKTKAQWARRTQEDIDALVEKINGTKQKNGTFTPSSYEKTGKWIIVKDKEYWVQGFEDAVLYHLADLGIEFSTGKDVPRIFSNVNKSGVYRPDIYIKDFNLILEVKSRYTFFRGFEAIKDAFRNAMAQNYIYIVLPVEIRSKHKRILIDSDKSAIKLLMNMIISSQAQGESFLEKVQRLSVNTEYRPIAIGSGSARVPKESFISYEQLRDMI